MNVAAYVRKTLTGVSVRGQLVALKKSALDRDWTIVWQHEDPSADFETRLQRKHGESVKSRHKREDGLVSFLRKVLHDSSIRIQGVMFWHAGDLAGSLKGFVSAIQLIDQCELAWSVENPKISSQEDSGRSLVALSSDLLGIDNEITGLNLRERSANMKLRGTTPGHPKISAQKEADIRTLRHRGTTLREIARLTKVSYAVVSKVLKESEL